MPVSASTRRATRSRPDGRESQPSEKSGELPNGRKVTAGSVSSTSERAVNAVAKSTQHVAQDISEAGKLAVQAAKEAYQQPRKSRKRTHQTASDKTTPAVDEPSAKVRRTKAILKARDAAVNATPPKEEAKSHTVVPVAPADDLSKPSSTKSLLTRALDAIGNNKRVVASVALAALGFGTAYAVYAHMSAKTEGLQAYVKTLQENLQTCQTDLTKTLARLTEVIKEKTELYNDNVAILSNGKTIQSYLCDPTTQAEALKEYCNQA